ncbi:MAG TPA: SUMF1/EgtB/PvdO family nonheme iron enzyme, partial [Isosphaeraceae bacterium]|nr:SUMF1/EgtB/PvdO family nonheme iron enzyme [Isosphaeraceae bacterium]
EEKAKALLEEARQYARKGTVEPAVMRLELLRQSFKDTVAAHEAEAALARLADGFPLFPDGPVVQASAVESPAQTAVSAEEAQAPAVEAQAVVQVQAPPMVPEVVADNSAPAAPRKLLPDGFRARPGAGLHESGWPREITGDRDQSSMILVPGGTYREGNDRGALAERPEHLVTLSTFYIDRHEVTNRQMEAFRQATGVGSGESTEAPERPVVNVSLADARAYAEWAGKAIPSEAQWEAAARSPDGRLYPWGRGPANWSHPREPRQIDPVMTYPTDLSPLGAFDMAGNAWEWTNDIFSTSYYGEIKKTPSVDPTGPERSHSRIVEYTVKGGSNEWDVPWRSGMRPEAK